MRSKLCIYDSMRANDRAQELVTLGRSTARTPLSMVSPASMPADPESAPLRSPAGLRPELETDLGWRRVWVAACLPSANQGSRRGFSSLRRFFSAWALTQQRSVPAQPLLPLLPPVMCCWREAAGQQPACFYISSARQLTKTAGSPVYRHAKGW
jgi:hypothetical protein